ncbi:MAG: DinB family protein [Caldilineaceae bacterium]
MKSTLSDLVATHGEVSPLFQSVPNESLNWKFDENGWSVKQILVHLTHANDFYLMILEEARAANFGAVRLHTELPGWQRMVATDTEAWQCGNVAELYNCFGQAFQRLMADLETFTEDELDQPFELYEMQPNAKALPTTLRQRVLQIAENHLREHKDQLTETLVHWQSIQSVE